MDNDDDKTNVHFLQCHEILSKESTWKPFWRRDLDCHISKC